VAETPSGIIEILDIKGLGPKKNKTDISLAKLDL
jgi:hypothetical protein